MPKFSVDSLILGSGLLTATGSNLYLGGGLVTADTSNLATITNLYTTGSILQGRIDAINIASGNLSTVKITGSNAVITSNFTGIGSATVSLSGNTVLVSGLMGTNNIFNNYYINSGSGFFVYRSGINSGVNKQFIAFPTILDNLALTIATVHNNTDNTILSCQISGTVSSGFWAILPTTTTNTGYYLDIVASNYTNTGFAITTIVNNTIINVLDHANGINLSGNLTITGQTLRNNIGGLSGIVNTTIANLATTGQTLYNNIIGLSGLVISVGTWSSLTWAPTTIWTAQANVSEDKKILRMTGNTTLSINSLYNGWMGVLQTIQSGNTPSGYILTLPANTKVESTGNGSVYLTSGSGAYDFIGLAYDGSRLFANIGSNYT